MLVLRPQCAALYGQDEVVELLLARGVNIGVQDSESGYTALHRAFSRGHLTTGALLVQAGASVDSPLDHEGLSPLGLLCVCAEQGIVSAAPDAPGGGFVMSWGASGSVALGRVAGSTSHAVAAGRVELPGLAEGGAVRSAASSKMHSMLLDSDGCVHTCGLGVGGRLGHGDELAAVQPRRVRLPVRVTSIAAGDGLRSNCGWPDAPPPSRIARPSLSRARRHPHPAPIATLIPHPSPPRAPIPRDPSRSRSYYTYLLFLPASIPTCYPALDLNTPTCHLPAIPACCTYLLSRPRS